MLGIQAVGVDANNYRYWPPLMLIWNIREQLATVGAFVDVYVIKPVPVLGKPEPIFTENSMNRDEALALVREYVKNEGLVRHMFSVEACMRFYAEKFSEDVEAWGLLGLIHDFDWEIHPTLNEHPTEGAPILRERGVSEELIQDILSHGEGTGVPRDT